MHVILLLLPEPFGGLAVLGQPLLLTLADGLRLSGAAEAVGETVGRGGRRVAEVAGADHRGAVLHAITTRCTVMMRVCSIPTIRQHHGNGLEESRRGAARRRECTRDVLLTDIDPGDNGSGSATQRAERQLQNTVSRDVRPLPIPLYPWMSVRGYCHKEGKANAAADWSRARAKEGCHLRASGRAERGCVAPGWRCGGGVAGVAGVAGVSWSRRQGMHEAVLLRHSQPAAPRRAPGGPASNHWHPPPWRGACWQRQRRAAPRPEGR